MATYQELQEQAAQLLAQADEMKRIEIAEVIADIRNKMVAYGLTIQDLGKDIAPHTTTKSAALIKYRGPNGQPWGGGRGKKPAWVYAAIKAGEDIEKFAV